MLRLGRVGAGSVPNLRLLLLNRLMVVRWCVRWVCAVLRLLLLRGRRAAVASVLDILRWHCESGRLTSREMCFLHERGGCAIVVESQHAHVRCGFIRNFNRRKVSRQLISCWCSEINEIATILSDLRQVAGILLGRLFAFLFLSA